MVEHEDDPSTRSCTCGAEPGEPCDSLCDEVVNDFSAADLVPVADAHRTYAVKHCPRCLGRGRDRTEPDPDKFCRCVLDWIDVLDLRADELLDSADDAYDEGGLIEHVRVTKLAVRWRTLGLAAALRETGHNARADVLTGTVRVTTVFGAVRIAITASGLRVKRTDGTEWDCYDGRKSRPLAMTARSVIPELAARSGTMLWIATATAKPGYAYRRPEVLGVDPSGEADRSRCRHTATAPVGDCCSEARAKRAAQRLDIPGARVVVGAFPVPADALQSRSRREHAAQKRSARSPCISGADNWPSASRPNPAVHRAGVGSPCPADACAHGLPRPARKQGRRRALPFSSPAIARAPMPRRRPAMTETTHAAAAIHDCPPRRVRAVLAALREYSYLYDGDGAADVLHVGMWFKAHPEAYRMARDFAHALMKAAPEVAFTVYDAPRDSEPGEVHTYVRDLGLFSAPCDAHGEPTFSRSRWLALAAQPAADRDRAMGLPWMNETSRMPSRTVAAPPRLVARWSLGGPVVVLDDTGGDLVGPGPVAMEEKADEALHGLGFGKATAWRPYGDTGRILLADVYPCTGDFCGSGG
ncbi:hypothetical protein [Streptomyces sp. AA4]|nr:hypothetical protein [Streptomyces sp. AA4]